MSNSKSCFAGLSLVKFDSDLPYNLGDGIIIRQTYAHLFAHFLMAFNPPKKHQHHDGPWRTTKNGISFDILVEMEMPLIEDYKGYFDQEELIWLIASLFRISGYPYLLVSAISDLPYKKASTSEHDPSIFPVEINRRFFVKHSEEDAILNERTLNWIRDNWRNVADMMKNNPKFYTAFKAFDASTIQGKYSTSLLTLWGAIEQLFSANSGELKYRVSSNMAAFISPPGKERLVLFKKLSKLYNERSIAAHTAQDISHSPLVQTYLLFRRAILKMIETRKVPTQSDLEKMVFQVDEEKD